MFAGVGFFFCISKGLMGGGGGLKGSVILSLAG